MSRASFMVSQSDWLPMTMATGGEVLSMVSWRSVLQEAADYRPGRGGGNRSWPPRDRSGAIWRDGGAVSAVAGRATGLFRAGLSAASDAIYP